MSNTPNKNGKKLCNFFIREFPIESIGKCRSAGICYKSGKNYSWRQLTNNRFHKTPFYGLEIAGSCRFKHYF